MLTPSSLPKSVVCDRELYELSPAQESMVASRGVADASGVNIEQLIIEVPEDLDLTGIRSAWDQVVKRHDSLRIRITDTQQLYIADEVTVPWICSVVADVDMPKQWEALLQADRMAGFTLQEEVLQRWHIFRLGNGGYRLLWTFHHLLLDLRSIQIVITEWLVTYDALRTRQTIMHRPACSIRDYLNWHHRWVVAHESSLIDFWQTQLRGISHPRIPPHELLLTPPGVLPEECISRRTMTEAETQRLHTFAADTQTTVNTLVQAAWSLVLAAHARTEEVVFSSVRSGHHFPVDGAAEMAGLCINTLPVCVRLGNHRSVRSLITDLRGQSLAVRPYEHSPHQLIRRASEIAPGHPLYVSTVIFYRTRMEEELQRICGRPDWRFTLRERPALPLTVAVQDGSSLSLCIIPDGFHYGRVTAARMVRHLHAALSDLPSKIDGHPTTVNLLDEEEHRELCGYHNVPLQADAPHRALHHWFENQVDQHPEAIAIIDGEARVTYAELDRHANRLAHLLHRRGVTFNDMIGVCLDRSESLLIAVLGILKAGAAYLPLAHSLPTERLAMMVREACPRLLISNATFNNLLPSDLPRLDISSMQSLPQGEHRLDLAIQSHCLAYAIFTSGSTGVPKLVGVEHANITNLLAYATAELFRPSDMRCVPFIDLISFDSSLHQIFVPLALGGTLVALDDAGFRCSAKQIHAFTYVGTTPSALQLLLDTDSLPESIRCIGVGAEVIPPQLVTRLRSSALVERVFNFYGPTEATIYCTVARILDRRNNQECFLAPHTADMAGRVIGRPIANCRAYVVNPAGQLVPSGVPGELWIAGKGVTRGYINNLNATDDLFMIDPFQADGSRLYRTGDLARWRSDEQLEFLGRCDDQLKVHGVRIEPGEIELRLEQHRLIKQAAVAVEKRPDGSEELTAYFVTSTQEVPAIMDLLSHLRRWLPGVMVPTAFILLDCLPLTSSEKVNRKALCRQMGKSLSITAASEAPRDWLESRVADIWGALLKQNHVGIHDNFFELGGHSLLATQITSRLRDVLGMEFPFRRIFEAPTVAELAAQIRIIQRDGPDQQDEAAARVILPVSRDQALPLSYAQQRIWFLHQLEGPSSTYNISVVLELAGTLDLEALDCALKEIVRRHEVLHSRLVLRGDEPIQVVTPERVLPLSVIDLSECSDSSVEAPRLVRQETVFPFDLARDEPLRARLLRRGESVWTLLLTLHHGAADGWSIALIFRELTLLYGAFKDGKPSPLPELEIQYADYAVWQRGWFTEERRNRQLHYWQCHLAGAPDCLNLPTDRPRPPQESHRGGIVSFTVDAVLTVNLQELGRRQGVTLFMTLLAAWATLLFRYSGDEDLVVGSPVANRTQSSVENLIGFFVNTLALRADLSGNPSFLELLARLQHVCLDAYANQELPFEVLVEALGVTRNLAHAPLFQVLFVLQNTDQELPLLPDLKITRTDVESTTAKFDLTISITEGEGILAATLEYATDLFDRTTIERMSGHFIELLRSIIADPEQQISLLNLLSPEEKRRLLVDWNDTVAPLPEGCVHHFFEEQAALTPDATAVIFEDEILTYGELNVRANQLAHVLINWGVVPDTPVAIALERSTEMIVALLAILKAGGAYLPLDPEYPVERLAFMLEDSGSRIILTKEKQRCLLPEVQRLLCLDNESLVIARQPDRNPDHTVTTDNLAYIIYTSGSTGKPKGCLIEHRSVVRLVKNTNYFRVSSSDIFLQFAPISFDAATFEVWGALLNGTRLAVFPPHMPSPRALGAFIQSRGITILWLTAVLFNHMVDEELDRLVGISQLLAGGDILSVPHVRKYLRSLPFGHILINGYGPTENTTFTCCHCMDASSVITEFVPIGRPISNTTVFILDARQQLVPRGVPGELYIGGAGLARGYLNRPELTAEKFIPNPFSDLPGDRLYKTGDLARYRADGNIEFLGRMDYQVKIRGFRIELGEIEAALTSYPGIREAVVIVKSYNGDKRLVAYVVSATEQQPSVGDLRAFAKSLLPDYMLPTAWVFLPTLPLTPNGKIDRKELPEPEVFADSYNSSGDPDETPQNLLEQHLLRLWHKALGHSDFGIHANFFSRGGHSLIAARLTSEIEQLIGHKVPIASFFHAQTVASMAALLRRHEGTPAWSSLVPLQSEGEKTPLFALHGWGGDAYWAVHLAQKLAPDRPVYGLQAIGLDGKTPHHTSIDAMAEHYATQIRSRQPNGPYHLIGCSVGGWLAYAVADHLLRQGGTIGLIVLLDTHANANIHKWLNLNEWLELGSVRVSYHVNKLRHRPEGGRRAYLKKHLVSRLFYAKILLRKPEQSPEIETINKARFAHQDSPDVMDHTSTVVTFYRPPRLDLELSFVTTKKTKTRMFLFWYYYARRGVKVYRLLDNHYDYHSSYSAEPLAALLKELLHESENPGKRE